MLRSMTAFGRKVVMINGGELICELRCVNHRFLEQIIRLPEEFRVLESSIREQISYQLRRGKVECTLRWRSIESTTELSINTYLIEQLIRASQKIENLILYNSAPISSLDLLRWNGVIQNKEIDVTSIQSDILFTLESVLNEVLEYREREGSRITTMINERLIIMEDIITKIKSRLPDVLVRQRGRLNNRLAEVQSAMIPERLEQEMLFFIQRIDIEEELDRLSSHVTEVRRIIDKEDNAGRRLDFLMQELNRETNTLGSKSVDIEITRYAIDLKVLIEQMREQIQNVE